MPTLKLFFAPRTRSTRPRWVLEELGVPYELHPLDLSKGEHRSAAYLSIQPLGRVPALEVDGHTFFESAALCLHLADLFPEKGLCPPVGTPERAEYYQWMFFIMDQVEPETELCLTTQEGRDTAHPALFAAAKRRLDEAIGVLDSHLAARTFLVGERFTAADVVAASHLAWAKFSGLVQAPNVVAYVERMLQRPAAKKARSA